MVNLPDTTEKLPILIPEAALAKRTHELADEIRRTCELPLLAIAMLRGAVFFLVDLLRAVDDDQSRYDFITVRSYAGTESTGTIEVIGKTPDVEGRRVLLIDDIIDTGRSLMAVRALLLGAGALSVHTAVMVDKPSRREVDFEPDFVGFHIENRFIVGYGMDCDEHFRTCRDIKCVD